MFYDNERERVPIGGIFMKKKLVFIGTVVIVCSLLFTACGSSFKIIGKWRGIENPDEIAIVRTKTIETSEGVFFYTAKEVNGELELTLFDKDEDGRYYHDDIKVFCRDNRLTIIWDYYDDPERCDYIRE